MKINELPQDVREWALASYIGNEVGSDEYRDSQPYKGINVAASFFSFKTDMTSGLTEDDLAMLRELREWVDAILKDAEGITSETTASGMKLASNMYPGVDALEPVLTRAFNALWDAGVHPDGLSAFLLMDDYNMMKEIAGNS